MSHQKGRQFCFVRSGWLGFYSDALRMLQSYMVCKKDNSPFYINSENWIFGHRLGWNDYFTSLSEPVPEGAVLEPINADDSSDRQFRLIDYKNAMNDIFVYQPYLYEMADKIMADFGIQENSYISIFIRRGDKLLGESIYIPTELYVQRALEKNPSTIFVQTDDYRAVEEIRSMLPPTISVLSSCPHEKHGHFGLPIETSEIRSVQYDLGNGSVWVNNQNSVYLSSMNRQKPLVEFTKEEIKAHVEEMLVGMILCKRSRYLVTDFTGNVGRTLSFTHPLGPEATLAIEELPLLIAPGVRLLPQVNYRDEEYITNPRYHCIHNYYR